MIQFYAPDILETLTLPESESLHCCRVLRLKEKDRIYVVDGKGHRYECEISMVHNKHTAIKIVNTEELSSHWGVKITLAVAPTKNIDRMEWLLEKAVEIGVDRIVILQCEHSERKSVRHDRLEKIMISAMKQSLKGVLPDLTDILPYRDFISEDTSAQKFIGYCDDAIERRLFACEYQPGQDVEILIGPEGDFSPKEVELAMANGFVPVSFGNSRLRTETAALFAVQTVHIINQMKSK